jgi:hypothetical protein
MKEPSTYPILLLSCLMLSQSRHLVSTAIRYFIGVGQFEQSIILLRLEITQANDVENVAEPLALMPTPAMTVLKEPRHLCDKATGTFDDTSRDESR